MRQLSRTVLFGSLACLLAFTACGAEEPAEETPEAEVDRPPDPEAVAVANRLTSKLGANVTLVPTVRGEAEIGYLQPRARREQNFIVTTFQVKNLAANAIAGFQVSEFWFDRDGNTVTGDRVRFREPILPGDIVDIELRVPRDPAMDRSNYEFSHQNGDIRATLLDVLEDPEAEGEEAETEPAA